MLLFCSSVSSSSLAHPSPTLTVTSVGAADVTVTHCHAFISSLIRSARRYHVPDSEDEAAGAIGPHMELPPGRETNTVKEL